MARFIVQDSKITQQKRQRERQEREEAGSEESSIRSRLESGGLDFLGLAQKEGAGMNDGIQSRRNGMVKL
jgi:hypothetical protein